MFKNLSSFLHHVSFPGESTSPVNISSKLQTCLSSKMIHACIYMHICIYIHFEKDTLVTLQGMFRHCDFFLKNPFIVLLIVYRTLFKLIWCSVNELYLQPIAFSKYMYDGLFSIQATLEKV